MESGSVWRIRDFAECVDVLSKQMGNGRWDWGWNFFASGCISDKRGSRIWRWAFIMCDGNLCGILGKLKLACNRASSLCPLSYLLPAFSQASAYRSVSARSVSAFGLDREDDIVKKRLRKGSFTVEASFLIPCLLFIVAGLICLCLYLHDRSVLASCAAELAGKGAARKYQSEAELKEWLTGQAQGQAAGRLLALKEVTAAVEVTKQSVLVTYTGSTGFLGGLEICEEETAKRLNPVIFIRGTEQLKQLLEE